MVNVSSVNASVKSVQVDKETFNVVKEYSDAQGFDECFVKSYKFSSLLDFVKEDVKTKIESVVMNIVRSQKPEDYIRFHL
jgi:hypothetical protein